ncbi:hypothetical protein JMJ35_001244 [Cladonia borealis]|uniref:Uncharacterized protein n=1 Tax=Cladonia borealis TaxID=184061 RepID=A0AA39UEK1_9LECA|nr:hypothetical protein JMJ35_001244 [Cladonia borealis]
MKWTYLTLTALASVATACVVDLENRVTCPTRTISNITANFDNRPKNTTLNEYRHLNYNNISVENQGPLGIYRRGVVPHSEPHHAIAYPADPLATEINIPGITLSLDGTRTTSFDFYGVYVACLDLFNI